MSATRFLQLSERRQVLVRLCQTVNYGQIQDVGIRDCEPILNCPNPQIFVDVRLDAEENPHPAISARDFALCAEVIRLVALLDKIGNGKITKIEIRAGLPRRATFEHYIAGTDRLT